MSLRRKGWWQGRETPPPARPARRGAWAIMVAFLCTVGLPGAAVATHLSDWTHDHSKIPYRPKGLTQLKKHFGSHCNDKADDARTWFPHAVARGTGGYVKYHRRLGGTVGENIRLHIGKAHKTGALDYGIYGYNCRLMTGGSNWSTHAWGVAIDTNTARNPYGQDHWVGIGADGQRHYKYIPNLYKGWKGGHHFYWGINFPTPDPHHFQFVTGY